MEVATEDFPEVFAAIPKFIAALPRAALAWGLRSRLNAKFGNTERDRCWEPADAGECARSLGRGSRGVF